MKYNHRFKIAADLGADLDTVRAFHQRAASMAAITPLPVVVVMHESPTLLREGDEMEFTLWLGPIPLRWRARIENVTPTSFDDRQLIGPFKAWRHRHAFVQASENQVEVLDEITAHLSDNWLKKLLGMGMWLSMPLLFTYRGWKTQQLLKQQRRAACIQASSQDK